MAIKPLVLVFQELRSPTANIVNPTLSGCVIGPHYHVKTYEENKDEIFAGTYDFTNGVSIPAFPGAVPGMKLKSENFHLFFDDVRVVIDSGTNGEIAIDGVLTGDTAADFTSAGSVVKPGDTVKIEHEVTIAAAGTTTGTDSKITMDTTTESIKAGDFVTTLVGAASASGLKILEVTATYIIVESVVTEVVAAGAITINRYRVIRDAGSDQLFAVKALNSDDISILNLLQMTTNFDFAATGISYEITRQVDQAEILSGFTLDLNANSMTIDPAVTTTVDALVRAITAYDLDATETLEDEAKIYTEYTALDVSYANIPARIDTAADIDAQLGVTDSRNPLGLGALVMFGNSAATFYSIGLESEDLIGWAKAVDAVNRGKFYAQALLTQDAGVVGMFKANNVANEVPEVADYGMCIGNHALPDTATPAGSSVGAQLNDPGSGLDILFEDATADFDNTSDPVLPGDSLNIGVDTFIVDSIVNGNRLKIVAGTPFAGTATAITYTITRSLTKDQQAAGIAAVSSAFGNKRVVMAYPDKCQISGAEESGIYLTAVVAGMIIGLPSQAGITNKGASVIEKVYNTNWDYFKESQMDVIATGGTLIFAQEDPNGLPFIRHQLTTDPSIIETAEISVVKNNDFLSLFFKGIVKGYLGEWNVTPDLISALTVAINQGISFQKTNRVAKIGSPLIEGTLQSIEVSDISPDRVEIYLDTVQPKPLNTIGLHMIL